MLLARGNNTGNKALHRAHTMLHDKLQGNVARITWQKLPRANKTRQLLREQQLKLSTNTWSGRAPWNGGKFVCQSAWCQKAIEVGQRLFLTREGISWFSKNISKRKMWTFCVFKLLIWRQKMDRPRSASRTSIAVATSSPGRKTVVSFTTKCVVPRQIKPRILEWSIRTRPSNLSTVFIFVSREV